ncbi:MAG TPA: DUF6259 domain-containing protein [Gemmatimonadaceae bacterium]|nr:DUF6259 domain-containing protein [Gemmatimonadaceae bacterium]
MDSRVSGNNGLPLTSLSPKAVHCFLLSAFCFLPFLPPRTVRIESSSIRIGFDAADGRLLELVDRASGRNLVQPLAPGDAPAPSGDPGIWSLELLGGDTITPRRAHDFNARRLPGEGALSLTWSKFDVEGSPDLAVTVTVRLEGDSPIADWHIALHGAGALQVERVHFPRVVSIAPLGRDERLAVPRWMGALAKVPRALLTDSAGEPRRMEWVYPGALSLQALALYQENGPGFYAASHDTLAYHKTFAVWGGADSTIGFELTQLLENPSTPKTEWSQPYSVVIGTFHGDWITAAERYREWGTRQRWARESRLKRGLVPAWLTNTAMWIWNRGRSPGVIPPAIALQKSLDLPVSVYWHWWHHAAYDTGFPDYLPPREGPHSFTTAIGAAHAAGIHAMVYMNQRLWCTGTPSWTAERAARAAVKERDGSVRKEVYNVFDPQPCATMDVTTPLWQNKYGGMADTVLDQYGVDGIYMDQAVLSLVCWDSTHGHPTGGGHYWMDGFRKLERGIRSRAADGKILAGEGAGESWLPELDLMRTLQVSQERYTAPGSGWEPIPFFQAVYHPYGLTYGNYSSLVMPPYDDLWPAKFAPEHPLALLDERFRHQFYLEQARAFVWGLQPTIANFLPSQLEERPAETGYMLRLARLRKSAAEFLQYGTFVRAPGLPVPLVDVDLSRISIYAAQRGGPTRSKDRYPSAISAAWRSADGDVAIAIASIVDTPISTTISIDPAEYGLSAGGRIMRLDANGLHRIGTFGAAKVNVPLEIPAAGATVIELRGEKESREQE